MDAIVFIGHGSKKAEGNSQVLEFVDSMKCDIPVPIVETCFLEFAKPTIAQAIKEVVEVGATRVALVPMMFFSAGHAKIHIPQEIDEAKAAYPHVQFSYGRPIGVHDKLFDILQGRLQEVGFHPTEKHDDTAVLLVGRGSSDSDANSELYKIARILAERLHMTSIELSFIGVTTPTVEEGIDRCLKLGAKKVYVVPYFFFTGVLMERMEEKLLEFRTQWPNYQFTMTTFFGFHPELKAIFIDRAIEALGGEAKLNCDVCQYRLHALEHMDVHHHHHDHDHNHHHHEHEEVHAHK
ncbi:sirohydrochlorin chelatase [Bacillus alkalicellulosilyticus]|uniref:sirohydrochlorin chelatase n=1 Tax=Alkalihalobacterium alkalicellulosilyticum TaxID=1912214 RepID=UPI0009983A2F|nr:sirohydrochlorin chelatase [Bacillus alkalicellulosilyticus]